VPTQINELVVDDRDSTPPPAAPATAPATQADHSFDNRLAAFQARTRRARAAAT